MLLKNGADVNARDVKGTTPLNFTLYKKQQEMAKIRLQNIITPSYRVLECCQPVLLVPCLIPVIGPSLTEAACTYLFKTAVVKGLLFSCSLLYTSCIRFF